MNTLRLAPMTVAELCSTLGITRNAVNVQLKQLALLGLIRTVKTARSGTPGKPAVAYEAAPGSEDLHSKAYPTLLLSLLKTMQSNIGPDVLTQILEQTGRLMAQQADVSKPVSFDEGLRAAMLVADSIGATTEAIEQDGGIMVRNYSCPVGSLVREDPCLCQALAAFFSEATNCKVTEKCIREDRLICQYFIEKSASA